MNDTYLVTEGGSNVKTNNDDDNDGKNKNKTRRCSCRSKCLFVASCIFTFAVIGGFGFLFGPLVLQIKFPLHKFTPAQISVLHYRLRLELNENQSNQSINSSNSTTLSTAFGFHGRASLIFNNAQRTNQLRLISNNLHIERINLTLRHQISLEQHESNATSTLEHARSYHVVKVTAIRIEQVNEIWRKNGKELLLELKNPLEVGDYMLDIHYSGHFHSLGLHKSTYEEWEGSEKKNKTLIVLRDASRALPYFDNNQKVKFELSVARKTDVACFTNAALREVEPIKHRFGYIWEHFKTTPEILPTSLAIVIADYKSVNVTTSSPVVLKIFAPRKHHKRLAYASDVFPKIFEHFEEYFQLRYPLPKLDLLLVDDEEVSRPMASRLGLITLSSEHLQLDIIDDNAENRRTIYSAMAKAVALQFLQISLNVNEKWALVEGVAKFLAYDADRLESSWNGEEHFIENVVEKSLDEHGVQEELKIACVLRMVNNTVGGNVFQRGLSKFLTNSKFEFWESVENVQLRRNASAKQFLLSWWEHPGYPVISVSRTTGWNVLITQKSSISQASNDTFTVPLSYISKNQREVTNIQELTLSSKQILTNLFVPQEDWILFNYNRTGYYRVNYQLDDWLKLIKQLEEQSSAIPVINRAALINDAFALADDGLLRFDVPFKVINYLRLSNESDYLPWKASVDALNRHEAVFLDSSKYGIFRKFKLSLLEHLWPIRHRLNPKLCRLVETELCKMQHKPCVAAAREFYDKYKNRKDAVMPRWVLCTVLTHSETNEFDFLYHRLQRSENHNEIRVLLNSLTCTKNEWQLNSLLEESLHNIKYAKHIWPAMSTSAMSRMTGMAFLEEYKDQNTNATSNTSTNTNSREVEIWKIIIEDFLSTMSTTADLNKITKMSVNLSHSIQEKLNQARTQVSKRIEWTKQHLSSFLAELLK